MVKLKSNRKEVQVSQSDVLLALRLFWYTQVLWLWCKITTSPQCNQIPSSSSKSTPSGPRFYKSFYLFFFQPCCVAWGQPGIKPTCLRQKHKVLTPGLSRKSPEVFILKSFLEYLNGPPGLRTADIMDKFIVEPRFSLTLTHLCFLGTKEIIRYKLFSKTRQNIISIPVKYFHQKKKILHH